MMGTEVPGAPGPPTRRGRSSAGVRARGGRARGGWKVPGSPKEDEPRPGAPGSGEKKQKPPFLNTRKRRSSATANGSSATPSWLSLSMATRRAGNDVFLQRPVTPERRSSLPAHGPTITSVPGFFSFPDSSSLSAHAHFIVMSSFLFFSTLGRNEFPSTSNGKQRSAP